MLSSTPLFYILAGFILSYLCFPLFIKVLGKKQFFDRPDKRKVHKNDTVSLGGILILLCALFPLLFFFPLDELGDRKYFFSAIIIMFIVGLRDDILPLRPIYKLLSQIIPSFIIFFAYDVRLDSLYSLAPMINIPVIMSFAITTFTIVIITNSFNLIDGIDGLAASLGVVSLGTFSLYFYLTGETIFSFILLSFIGSILGFLIFNWNPAKIFMGDTGALLIGFLMAVSSIIFINDNFSSEQPFFNASISTAICFIGIPIFDTLRIIIIRFSKRKSPFKADNDHIHHVLQKRGLSHSQVTLILIVVQSTLITLPVIGRAWNEWQFMIILIGVFFIGYFVLRRLSGIKSKAKETGV